MKIKYILCFFCFPSLSCFAQLNSIVPMMGLNPATTAMDSMFVMRLYMATELPGKEDVFFSATITSPSSSSIATSNSELPVDDYSIRQTIERPIQLAKDIRLGLGLQLNFISNFRMGFHSINPSFSIQKRLNTKPNVYHSLNLGTQLEIGQAFPHSFFSAEAVTQINKNVGLVWLRKAKEISFELGFASQFFQDNIESNFGSVRIGHLNNRFNYHTNIGLSLSQRTQVNYYAIYEISKHQRQQLNAGIHISSYLNTHKNSHIEFGGGLIRNYLAMDNKNAYQGRIAYGKHKLKTILGILWSPISLDFDKPIRQVQVSIQLVLD